MVRCGGENRRQMEVRERLRKKKNAEPQQRSEGEKMMLKKGVEKLAEDSQRKTEVEKEI